MNKMLLMCIAMASVNLCVSQTIGSTAYSVRMRKTGLCAPSDIVTANGSLVLYKTMPCYNGYINVSRDFLVDKVIIKVQKCGDGYYPCEHFLTLKIDKNLREFALAKNQLWSPVYNTVFPKPKFPLIQKAVYRQVNTTFDINAIVKTIPEVADHTWKIRIEYHEKDTKKMICAEIQTAVLKYTVRSRKYH